MLLPLSRRLEAWKSAGLISAEQLAAIKDYEDKNSRSWATYGLTGIGVTTVATGVICLIAANWADLPDVVKIAGYFLLQGLLGLWVIRQDKRPGVWREMALAAFSLGFLAGIGLMAQIFHLKGDGWRALSFWLFLSVGAVLRSEARPLNHGWVLTLLYTSAMWGVSFRHPALSEENRMALVASIPLILTGLGFLSQRYFNLPQAFREAILTWGLASVLIGGTIGGNIFWHVRTDAELKKLLPHLVIPWTALLFAAASSWLRGDRISRALRGTTSATLVLWGLYTTAPFLLDLGQWPPMVCRIIGAAGFIAIGLCCSGAAALSGYRRLYDLATLIVAGRIVVIYFEVFGSMAQTGLGLIVTGLFLLGLGRLWQKHRSRLLNWMEGVR